MTTFTHLNSDVYHIVPKHLAHTALCGERPGADDTLVENEAPAGRRPCEWCDESLQDLVAWNAR